MLTDLRHTWGGDLEAGPAGDLALMAGSPAVSQRVLRRLLTAKGDYIWSPTYGAGLPGYVGRPTAGGQIEATVRSQMLLETAVARFPPPSVTIADRPETELGVLELLIRYQDAATNQDASLSVAMTG
jgi:phage baseplate assembly protein W